MDNETAGKMRGMIRRATLKNIKDDGQTQTASVEVAEGVWRDDVEILQPYGFASHVPGDGALAVVLAVGSDEGDLVVLPVANPSKRLGKLGEGDVGLYGQHGDRMTISDGGTIELQAGESVSVKIGGVTFVVSAEGVDITGGHVKHNGKNIGSTHKHGGVVAGGDDTDVPSN
ncbi:phage baseplate assembly protein [Rhizobium leguminosarum bv. viciae 248]|uniref:phage baseplate assembly protein domain-containing protein n=1 Tax=Rhizobium leguminosarum TaxID=384 RepID=UPI000380FE73|nr:phage baseplate assembly protein [Rhizobium leguminosarum]QHW25640.1 phage baseplate assembly protein [Rhizobium leguminosarum bv. viciae 248]